MGKKSLPLFISAVSAFILISNGSALYSNDLPLSDAGINTRLTFLSESLKEQQVPAMAWWGGWLAVQSIGVIFSTSSAILNPHIWRVKAVTGVQSAIGLAGLLIAPLDTAYGYDIINSMPDTTVEERFLKLRMAEELLFSAARRERVGSSWIAHFAGAALGITGGLLIWLAFDRPWHEGALNLLIMVVGAEARILTQPVTAVRHWDEYQRRFLHDIGPADYTQKTDDTSVSIMILPGFFYASLRF